MALLISLDNLWFKSAISDSLTQHDVDNDSEIADLNQRLSNEINRAKESERDI